MSHGRSAGAAASARMLGATLALTLALAGCTPFERAATAPTGPALEAAPSTEGAASVEQAVFTAVIDGDTIETSAGTVRLMGIDTPERGECGHDDASMAIGRLIAAGESVTLSLPVGQNDQDGHGRLIRHVSTSAGVDLALMQLQSGTAIARYDSSDGYPAHPHEAAYHAAQIASRGGDGRVVTAACGGAEAPAAQAPEAVAAPEGAWWQQYSSCTKLRANAAGHPTGPFDRADPAEAQAYDWFAFGTGNNGDGDGDGLACE